MSKIRNAPKYLEQKVRSSKHIRIQYYPQSLAGFHSPKDPRKEA